MTTGQAAKLCSVTPDTVLKWIRKGRIPAVRTAGGHYRIDPQNILPFVRKPSAVAGVSMREPGREEGQALRCWEYLSDGGTVSEKCKECVVYQVRAAHCFKLADMQEDLGHSRRFCSRSCDDCGYYRRVKGLPTNVLVVTGDELLIRSLSEEARESVSLRVARNDYEASATIESFRPTFVVVDRELCREEGPGLLESLASDPRVPGLRIILAVPGGTDGSMSEGLSNKAVSGVIEKPFSLRRIAAMIESLPVESKGEGAHDPNEDEAAAGA